MSQSILQASHLRTIEAEYAKDSPPLMERAGACAARMALEMLAGTTKPALILAGPGNNGGDALVVARLLKDAGHPPVVLFIGEPDRLPDDARQAHAAWIAAGGSCLSAYPDGEFGLIVDGLFGIGLARPIEGIYANWIERANASGQPILALDVPSGLNAITGQTTGPIVRANRTVTFIALKPGLLTCDGPDYCGSITVCDLDLKVETEDGKLVTPALFRHGLQPRRRNSHKGSHGSLAVIGGAAGMTGAALLAARAGLKLGAGRVFVGLLHSLAVDPVQPELMLRTPDDALAQATAVVIGPGLGASDAAVEILRRTAIADFPLLLDADALNLLAAHPVLAARVARRDAPTLITPHPAEAARLLATLARAIQYAHAAGLLQKMELEF